MAPARGHPSLDDSLDLQRFVPVDGMDPRCRGEGPCGFAHENALADLPDVKYGNIRGNQNGKWVECGRCALRLGYWPKKGKPGKCKAPESPRAVRLALSAARAAGLWDRCTATDVKAALEVARGRPDQAKDRGSGRSGVSGQVPRAASWGPATAHSSEPPARSRAASNEPRKHVHLTLNAGPGTIVNINC